jgi:uncharacterized protein (DUF885 family)
MTNTVQEYETLEQEITESRLRWSPAAATSLGRHEWDEELGDRSPEAMEARSREVADQIRRLERIDAVALPEPYRTRLPIHLKKLRFELSEEEDFEASRRSPGAALGVVGFACNGLMIRDFAPATERLRLLSGRLRRVPDLLQQYRVLYQSSTPIQVDTALQQAAGVISLFERDLPAFAHEAGDDAADTTFEAARTAALEAARSYAAWLENEVRPNANAPIAWGTERMERLVRWQECVDLDLDEIVRRGEADLRAYQARLRLVAAQIDPSASIQVVVSGVGKDHPSAAELLPFTETTLEQLRQFCIDRELIDMPTEVRIGLKETPQFSRATTLAACSTPGKYETVATEAYYYVTPPDPIWDAQRTDQYLQFFSRWALPLITAHEAYPGHYVHLSWLRLVEDSVPFTNSTTTVEGWAHYTEQLMIESGWGDGDPRYEIAQIREALLRLCRYLAAFGLHIQGWSYEEAVEFFMREGYATRPVAELESRRGVVSPSYFAYTLGKHEILDLRERLKEQWGPAFSLKRFHNAFVKEPYPTAVIAEKMLA